MDKFDSQNYYNLIYFLFKFSGKTQFFVKNY